MDLTGAALASAVVGAEAGVAAGAGVGSAVAGADAGSATAGADVGPTSAGAEAGGAGSGAGATGATTTGGELSVAGAEAGADVLSSARHVAVNKHAITPAVQMLTPREPLMRTSYVSRPQALPVTTGINVAWIMLSSKTFRSYSCRPSSLCHKMFGGIQILRSGGLFRLQAISV